MTENEKLDQVTALIEQVAMLLNQIDATRYFELSASRFDAEMDAKQAEIDHLIELAAVMRRKNHRLQAELDPPQLKERGQNPSTDQYGNMIRIEIMKVAELAQNYDLKVRVKHEPLDSGKLDYSKVRPSRLSVSLVDSEDPVWHYLTCDNRGIVSIELVKEKLC